MRTPRPAFHQALAHCLDHPDEHFADLVPLLRTCAPELAEFLAHATAVGRDALAREYVRTFDFRTRNCLYLTWWLEGDTRRRGEALVRCKQVYRAAGMECVDGELPDYLPLVLEYVAATGDRGPLLEHRPGLELLRLALIEDESPYATLLTALCSSLPGASPRDRAAARALARTGPRAETVGLVPYGHLDLLPVLDTGDR
ncbi:nitrate reductase molybdenum cofactor assembly chaperone [Nocardia takedensis]